MFVVDTNILLHAANSASPHHARARSLLTEWLEGAHAFHLTWGIVYEFLRVATHRAVFPKPLTFGDALAFVEVLVGNPRVEMLADGGEHAASLRRAAKAMPSLTGSRFHDLHTALLMQENGLSDIRTEDTDFHRFAWLRPTNPLARRP